jgi:hypothetical protein
MYFVPERSWCAWRAWLIRKRDEMYAVDWQSHDVKTGQIRGEATWEAEREGSGRKIVAECG